jgi:NAD(P)H-nitrite reductase large subunit
MNLNEEVCQCRSLTVGELAESIKEHQIKTVEELTEQTEAGCCCRSCVKSEGDHNRNIYLEDVLNKFA